MNTDSTLYITKRVNTSKNAQQVQIFCPSCWSTHYHGFPDGENEKLPTHRSSHCRATGRGLFSKSYGYYIDEIEGFVAPPKYMLFNYKDLIPASRSYVIKTEEDLYGDPHLSSSKQECSSTIYRFSGDLGCEVVKSITKVLYISVLKFDPSSDDIVAKTRYIFGTRADIVKVLDTFSSYDFSLSKNKKLLKESLLLQLK